MCLNIVPYNRKVQYYETDQMAIVHHSNYIKWFEEARIDLMEQIGYDYKSLEDRGILMPVLGISGKYIDSIKYGDTINIFLTVTKFTAVKINFSYIIKDSQSSKLKMTGTSEHCFVNKNFSPCSIKKEYPEFYNNILKYIERQNIN